MGYYTRYTLNILENSEYGVDYHGDIASISGYSSPFDDECKWYRHEEDMITLSERYPDVLFELIGEGEESPDFWKKYFRNGQMKICKGTVVYESFDPKSL